MELNISMTAIRAAVPFEARGSIWVRHTSLAFVNFGNLSSLCRQIVSKCRVQPRYQSSHKSNNFLLINMTSFLSNCARFL